MKSKKGFRVLYLLLAVFLFVQQPITVFAQEIGKNETETTEIQDNLVKKDVDSQIDEAIETNDSSEQAETTELQEQSNTEESTNNETLVVAPQAETTVVNFQVGQNETSESMNLSLRKIDETEWTTYTFNGSASQVTLENDVEYQFVINYASTHGSNSRNVLYKINGSRLVTDGSSLTIEMATYNSAQIAEFFKITQGTGFFNVLINDFTNIKQAIYKPSGYAKYFTTNPDRYKQNIVLYDEDGTVLPYQSISPTWGYKYIIPAGKEYPFVVSGDGIATAKGVAKESGSNKIVLEASENCTVENLTGKIFSTIFLEAESSIEFTQLISGSQIEILAADGLTTFIGGNNILKYLFNDDDATEANLTVKVSAPGTADIELAIQVTPAGDFTITNLTEVEKDASKIVVQTEGSERKIEIQQMAVGEITAIENGRAVIDFPALEAIANRNSIVTDAVNRYDGKLRVINSSGQKVYFESLMPVVGDNSNFYVLRGGSATRMFDYYRKIYNPAMEAAGETGKVIPEEDITPWNAKIVYDFENIVGKSMYDAMLELYQTDPDLIAEFGNITDLTELPDEEIYNSLIGGGQDTSFPGYPANSWGGNPNADYAYQADGNYFHVKETDQKMLALYLRASFTQAVSVSLDSNLYPLSSIGAGDEGLRYSSYISGTEKNKEIMREFATAYPSIEASGSIDFPNFSAVADQGVIFAAYQGTNILSGLNLEISVRDTQQGEVITRYVDENGIEISQADRQTGDVGSEYTTSAININGYTLDSTNLPDNSKGEFTPETITVIYVYKKSNTVDPPTQRGIVITRFVDQNGTEIAGRRRQTGSIGSNYITNAISIAGYTLDETKLPANASGQFINGTILVTYVYNKNDSPSTEDALVITRFVDQNGIEIANIKRRYQSGNIGDPYTTKPIEIPGYVLDLSKFPANASGFFTAETIYVTYVYKKIDTNPIIPSEQATVTTRFVDQNGNEIATSRTQNGVVGTDYTTQPIDILGYSLDPTRLPENANGQFTVEPIIVTYVYQRITSGGTIPNTGSPITTGTTPTTSKNLPNTGTKNSEYLIVLGVALLGILGGLVVIKRRKMNS